MRTDACPGEGCAAEAAPREAPTSNDVSRHEGTPSRDRMTRNYSRSRAMRLNDPIVTTVTSRAFGSFTLK